MELGLGLTKIIPPVLYGLGIFAVLLTLLYRIEIGILLSVLLLPLENVLRYLYIFPLGKDFLDILLLATLIKWILNKSKSDYTFFEKTPLTLPLVLLVIWSYIALWNGTIHYDLPYPINPHDPRFQAWKNVMMMPLLYFIIINNVKDERYIKILLMLMCVSFAYSGNNFYRESASSRSAEGFSWGLKSASGTMVYLNTNSLGAYFSQYTLLFTVIFLSDNNKFRGALFGLTTLYGYYGVIYSFSRGAWIALAVGLTFLGLVRYRIILFILLVIFSSWREILPPSVIDRIDTTVTEEGELESSAHGRIDYFEQGSEKFFSMNPLIGGGFATIKYVGLKGDSGKTANDPHNGYLEILLEQGIVGLGIFLWLFFSCIKAGWKLYKTSDDRFYRGLGLGFTVCVISAMVSNLTGDRWSYVQIMGYFWVVMALVARSQKIVETKKDNDFSHDKINSKNNKRRTFPAHNSRHFRREPMDKRSQHFSRKEFNPDSGNTD